MRKPGQLKVPSHRKATAVPKLGISNADPNMKTGRLRVPNARRANAALNPGTNPFLDRVEHHGMKAILLRVRGHMSECSVAYTVMKD